MAGVVLVAWLAVAALMLAVCGWRLRTLDDERRVSASLARAALAIVVSCLAWSLVGVLVRQRDVGDVNGVLAVLLITTAVLPTALATQRRRRPAGHHG